ncbi:MAG: response regulator [Bacteroidota bacterium]
METATLHAYDKVMVVDDSEVDRFIIHRMMTINAFSREILLMPSAKAAINSLLSIQEPGEIPSLIFLDIRMPEIDGFEFLNMYSRLSDTIKKRCSVIMISSSCDDSDRRRVGINPYVHSFIDKPISKSKLETIKSLQSQSSN